jgi:hypothetical protein
MPALDPGICLKAAKDCRVEPGNDDSIEIKKARHRKVTRR